MSIVSMIIFIYVGSCWLWINQIDHSTSGLQTWVCKTSTKRHDLKAEAPGHSSTTGLENGRTVDPSEEWQLSLAGSWWLVVDSKLRFGSDLVICQCFKWYTSTTIYLPLVSFNGDQPTFLCHSFGVAHLGSTIQAAIWRLETPEIALLVHFTKPSQHLKHSGGSLTGASEFMGA